MLDKLFHNKDTNGFWKTMRRLGFKNIECVIGGTSGAFRNQEQIFEVKSIKINR